MKNIRDCKVGDIVVITKKDSWGGNTQEVVSKAKITVMGDDRCQYETVEVISAKNVMPDYDPMDVKGGFHFRLFDKPISSFSVAVI